MAGFLLFSICGIICFIVAKSFIDNYDKRSKPDIITLIIFGILNICAAIHFLLKG